MVIRKAFLFNQIGNKLQSANNISFLLVPLRCFHPLPSSFPGKDTQKTTLTNLVPASIDNPHPTFEKVYLCPLLFQKKVFPTRKSKSHPYSYEKSLIQRSQIHSRQVGLTFPDMESSPIQLVMLKGLNCLYFIKLQTMVSELHKGLLNSLKRRNKKTCFPT